MYLKRVILPLLTAATLAACGADQASQSTQSQQFADRILTGGRIYTVDDENPWAEAVAIMGDSFIYVGDAAGAEKYVGDSTVRSHLGGRLVIPGLIDSHTHPGMMGIEQFGPSLPDSGKEDLLSAVKEYAESDSGDGWIKMCCWSNYDYISGSGGPHKEDLNAIVPGRPVWLTSLSWHSYWLNSKGLEVLGVTENTPDPRPGVAVYVRDENNELTGWIKEGAGWQYFAEQFPADPEAHRKGMQTFLEILSGNGVTTVYDGGNFDYEDEVYGFLAELEAAGQLPLRYEGTYQVYLPERRHLAIQEMKRLRAAYGGERLRFRTVKLFMDGINSNRSGGVLEPYADDPDYVGATLLTMEELRDFLLELHEEQFDLHIHTIGDLAVRTALDAVEAAKAIIGESFYPRVTLAHLQVIDPTDWPRFGELGVTANFTAWWHGVNAKDPSMVALGEPRSLRSYPAKELFDTDGNVTFSSDDWTPDVLSPFLGMQVGHNRQFPNEWLADRGSDFSAFRPPASEKLDLELMLRGYTINGAYAFRMEDRIGSIEVGKIADLLVLDENLFEIDRNEIHKIRPAAVMMEGKLLHGELP